MRSILENLFCEYDCTYEKDQALLQRIATNTELLEKDFNNRQQERFLDMIDDKDFLAVQQASDSFASGLRYGVLFMIEVFSEKGAAIDD